MKSAPGLFGVTGRQRDYIDDVLGSVDKDGIFNYLADLLDAKSPEEFDATLQSLRQRWVERGERWTFLSTSTKTTQNQTTTNWTFYLEKLRKATMEELYAAENPTSLSLVPDSIIRRQEAVSSTLDSGKVRPDAFSF